MLDLTEFLKIFSLHNSMETRIKNLYVFFAALTLRSWSLWVETIIYKKLFREGWYLRCPICALVLGYWELSHVIFPMLKKKELLAKALQFHKLTIVFTQNGPRLSFGVKIVAILWICSALEAVFFVYFSAWEKSRDSTSNSQKLEHM